MKAIALQLVLLCVSVSIASASPSIIWSGVQDIQKPNTGPMVTWHMLDLDDNGVDDFHLFYEDAGFYIEHVGAFGPNLTVVDRDEIGLGGVIPLVSGTLIGADTLPADRGWRDTNYRATFQRYWDPGGVSGPWHEVDHGILGLMFDIDGSTHYGWADISDVDGYQMILHSWAYETQPGVPILAGAVPEPSTWVLFLTGLGCLVGRYRLRKRAQR